MKIEGKKVLTNNREIGFIGKTQKGKQQRLFKQKSTQNNSRM